MSKTSFRSTGFCPRRENHARMREDHASRQNDPRNGEVMCLQTPSGQRQACGVKGATARSLTAETVRLQGGMKVGRTPYVFWALRLLHQPGLEQAHL